jgi:rare lipoprotein A
MRRLFSHSVHVCLCAALLMFGGAQFAHAEVASIYGGSDGLCGSRTANGEHLDCSAMTAAHRTLPFGTLVRVCHVGCVVVRINDRGPFVRGRHIDLSPAAAHAIGLRQTGEVAMTLEETPDHPASTLATIARALGLHQTSHVAISVEEPKSRQESRQAPPPATVPRAIGWRQPDQIATSQVATSANDTNSRQASLLNDLFVKDSIANRMIGQ